MGTKYLLDTNVVLNFMGRKLPAKSRFFLSAIINDFTLITHNVKDFKKITELQIIDPASAEQ